MKIPQTTNANARPNDDVNKTSPRRNANGVETGADETGETGAATGRDFASVLEEIARPRENASREDESDGERFDSKARERAEGEPEARRREEREGGADGGDSKGGGGFDQRGAVREAASQQDAAGARAILHIADLERIISAVRTQTLASGAREVTLELRRSVLEGLRVKLSLDAGGRVSAEFIAASERVRAQIDARAGELAEILRSRGVQLASLRTSVGADASGEGSRGGQSFGAPDAASRIDPASPSAVTSDDAVTDDAGEAGAGTTYRA